jgi:cytoskeletal protein RodZ
MALSQDEQRMPAEIERRLAADDPGLASCLTTFRRPGPATMLRSPRARIVGSLFTVLLVAMVSLMVYAMIPFRAHMLRHTPPPATTAAPANTTLSDARSGQPNRTQQSSAGSSTGAKSTSSQAASSQAAAAGQTATSRSAAATSTATGKSQQAKVNPTNTALLPEASP